MTEPGINLPPSLAARRAELIESVVAAQANSVECQRMAALYVAEIAGIDGAAEAFAEMLAQATGERIAREEQPAPTTSDPPKERRERRDIRGMVLDALRANAIAIAVGFTTDQLVDILPEVRRVQIEAALAYHEAGGRIRCHLPSGYWRIVGQSSDDPAPDDAELALDAAG